MRRLISVLRFDLFIQIRYGFLYGAIVAALVWVVLLKPLPVPGLVIVLPPAILFDLGIVGFYFLSILVLYDKGQATLYALVVSPLRFWEYLTSKLVTLTLLAVVLSLMLVFFTYGLAFHIGLFTLGTALMSVIALLVGFIAVAPFRSISSYLMPSGLYVTWLSVPIVTHFGWWTPSVFFLFPTQGPLWLLQASFTPLPAWQVLYSLLSSMAWIIGLGLLAQSLFDRYIVERKGRR